MFRTEIVLTPSEDKISHSSPVLSIGSCFSNCIGQQLSTYKFDALANPFGTVYNPVSIFKLLDYAINNIDPNSSTYLETQGLKANYDFHSSFSSEEQGKTEEKIHEAINHTHAHLKSSKWLIITFGTSSIYRRKDNKVIVANCQKVPASHFNKEMLSHEGIILAFEKFHQQLRSFNPGVKIILTVSPVRHIKDSLEQNSVSKAILRVACDTLAKTYTDVHYFPSYEIMMDDLRDYRFYKSDMLHPTVDAEGYIWKKFSETYFDQDTLLFMEEWAKILRAIKHRPFNPASDAHQQFILKTIEHLKQLSGKVNVTKELLLLKNQKI